MEPVPTCDAGFRTACCATRRRVPRPTTFLAGFTSPDTPFHGPEAGKRRSEARSRAPEPGGRGPEGRFQGLEGGMNGPVGGISASEARVRHRVGGKRTKLGRARTKADRDQSPGHGPPALKILATREAVVGVTKEPQHNPQTEALGFLRHPSLTTRTPFN